MEQKNNKLCQVIMLSTEKARLGLVNNSTLSLTPLDGMYKKTDVIIPQHLYLITDEEIKEGDWMYQIEAIGNSPRILQCKTEYPYSIFRKVIASTDRSLTIDGFSTQDEPNTYTQIELPQMPESFILAYVKAQGKIDSVLVEYEAIDHAEEMNTASLLEWKLKVRENNTVIIHQSRMYSREEVIKLINKFGSDLVDRIDPLLDGVEEKDMKEFGQFNIKWITDNL